MKEWHPRSWVAILMGIIVLVFVLAALAGCSFGARSLFDGRIGADRAGEAPTPAPAAIAAPADAPAASEARTVHCQNTIVLSQGARVPAGGINVQCVDSAGKPVELPPAAPPPAAAPRAQPLLFELRPVR